jgi:hypothetical protein
VWRPVEHLPAEQVFLDGVASTGPSLVDNVSKEARKLRRFFEPATFQNLLELRLDFT